jgi:hypothetical protein
MDARRYAELTPTQRRQRAAYLRKWRRGQIEKRNCVARVSSYHAGYARGYRAARKSMMHGC